MVADDKIIQLELPLIWYDDVRTWGNPHLSPPLSDARFLHEATYTVMRQVIGKEFSRTYAIWRQKLIQARSDETELLEIALLEREAMRQGISNIQDFIAARIGCSRQRISLLLQFISLDRFQEEIGDYWHTSQNMAFIGDGEEIAWKPSSKQIQRKKKSIPRICAGGWDGCKGESNNGALPLCKPCHEKALLEYGSTLHFPDWLQSEINRIRREHYEAVKDACYKDHFGTLSMDELDTYLDAA